MIAALRQEVAALRADVGALKWRFGITWALLVLVLGAVGQLLLRGPR